MMLLTQAWPVGSISVRMSVAYSMSSFRLPDNSRDVTTDNDSRLPALEAAAEEPARCYNAYDWEAGKVLGSRDTRDETTE